MNLIKTFIVIKDATAFLYISFDLDFLALVFALMYLLKGYGKKNVKVYRYFLITYGLACLTNAGALTIVADYYPTMSFFLTMIQTIVFGVIMVLYFAKDLGQKVSEGLTLVTLLLMVIVILASCIYLSLNGSSSTYDTIIDLAASRYFALAYTLYICVKSKYADKADRNTR